ncbi:MAG: leucine-rich repeat protein [Clostridia bacterium]|nr:leucine-rich repeat protein [Clostridia bacterium]
MFPRKYISVFAALIAAVMLFSCSEHTDAEITDNTAVEGSANTQNIYSPVGEYPIYSMFFPEGVTDFNDAKLSTVENLYVASDNPDFRAVDGIIFTKDEKTLVAFPAGRKGDCIIPDGTEIIGKGAFEGCTIQSVYIPDSVTLICDGAFEECMNLEEISMPRGISVDGEVLPRSTVTPEYPLGGIILRFRDVGTDNLDTREVSKTFPELAEYERIEYGSWVDDTDGTVTVSRNRYGFLRFEGNDALYMTYSAAYLIDGGNVAVPEGYSGIKEYDTRLTKRPVYAWTFPKKATAEIIIDYNTSIEDIRKSVMYLHTDEESNYFTSVDGVVFTKDLKTLIAFPAGRSGHYNVPEGTEMIGEKAFFCTSLDGITLPSSITVVHEYAFSDKWSVEQTAPVIYFAAGKETADKVMADVYGDFEIIYREFKPLTESDVTVIPIQSERFDYKYSGFTVSINGFETAVKANADKDFPISLYVEDLTDDGYPEIVITYTSAHGTELHLSDAIVLDGITLEEYPVENVALTIPQYVQLSASEDMYSIDYPNVVSYKIKKSRFGAAKENQFDRAYTENYYHFSVLNGKLHCSVACQFTITEFYGSFEVDLKFEDGKFVYGNSEFVEE